jgi:hypothetical protein
MDDFFEPVVEFTTKFSDDLVDEISKRDINFYLYLIPPALVPWFTSQIINEPSLKSYIDIVVISIYTTVLFQSTA